MRQSSHDVHFSPAFESENRVDSQYIAEFKGFIHPLNSGNNRTAIKMYLIAAAAKAYLYISTTDSPQLKVCQVDSPSVARWHFKH